MFGANGFMLKAFGLFVGVEILGAEVEKGLASLKSIVESANKK